MSFDADALVDRRRLRRKLTFWRVATFLILAIGLISAVTYVTGLGDLSKRSPHIARIPIEGVILDDRELLRMIDRIGKSDSVRGVIVSINSPGGSTTGGEAIYGALQELAAKKPVVAEMRTIATSAGYMIALASDHIVARYNTITGSIGVLFQFGNIEKLLQTLGIHMEAVKSAELKAEPDFYSETTPEARAMLQSLVTDSYDWFVGLVAERRKLPEGEARQLSDGRILTGHSALAAKLIDEIGGEAEAVSWLVKEKDVAKDLPVVTWKVKADLEELPFSSSLAKNVGIGIGTALFGTLDEAKGLISRGIVLDGLVSVWQAPNATSEKP